MTYVTELFAEIVREELLEDRREYCVEDFQLSYGLTETEATALYNMVQKEFA